MSILRSILNLEEIVDLRDCLHETPNYSQDGYPMIRVKDIRRGFLDLSGTMRVDNNTYEKFIKNYQPLIGDILFSRVGSYGNSCFVNRKEYFCIGQNTVCISPKRNLIEPFYLYCCLNSHQVRDQIESLVGGASQPTISLKNIYRLSIPYPPLPTQKRIAAILSAYDDLIENNNHRIKILEEMAKLNYKEWFVDFRFPGHENVKMFDSPLGMIPEGWTHGTLDNVLIELESGSRPKGGVAESAEGIPSIGAENILGLGKYEYSKEKYISQEFFNNMRRGHVKSGDVLLYKDGAQIGRKSLFRDNFPYDTCCINEHVFILRCNDRITQNYLFFWLDLPDVTQMIRNLNANAAQPGINQSSVRGLPILIPTRDVLNAFQNIVEPLTALLFNLAKQNRILQITRDCLLPKLISGEIDVSDLDIDIAEAAA